MQSTSRRSARLPTRRRRTLAGFGLALLCGPLQALATPPEHAGQATPITAPVEIAMDTPLGRITLWLDPARAPLTVANFLRYVDAGKLDDSTFYRTVRLDNQRPEEVPIQVVQGGMLGRTSTDGEVRAPDWFEPVAHEPTSQTGLRHVPGAISMARAQPGSATSEFFISVVDSPALDSGGSRNPDGLGFAVFGHVVDGMDVVRRIHAASTAASGARKELGVMQGQLLDTPIRICSVARIGTAGDGSPAPGPQGCGSPPGE